MHKEELAVIIATLGHIVSRLPGAENDPEGMELSKSLRNLSARIFTDAGVALPPGFVKP